MASKARATGPYPDPIPLARELLNLPRKWQRDEATPVIHLLSDRAPDVSGKDVHERVDMMEVIAGFMCRARREAAHLMEQLMFANNLMMSMQPMIALLPTNMHLSGRFARNLAEVSLEYLDLVGTKPRLGTGEFSLRQNCIMAFSLAVLSVAPTEVHELSVYLSRPDSIKRLLGNGRRHLTPLMVLGALSHTPAAMDAFVTAGHAQWLVDNAVNEYPLKDELPSMANQGQVTLQVVLAANGHAEYKKLWKTPVLWSKMKYQLRRDKSRYRVAASAIIAFASQTVEGCRAIIANGILDDLIWGFQEFLGRITDHEERCRRIHACDLPELYRHTLDVLTSLLIFVPDELVALTPAFQSARVVIAEMTHLVPDLLTRSLYVRTLSMTAGLAGRLSLQLLPKNDVMQGIDYILLVIAKAMQRCLQDAALDSMCTPQQNDEALLLAFLALFDPSVEFRKGTTWTVELLHAWQEGFSDYAQMVAVARPELRDLISLAEGFVNALPC